MDNVDNHQLVPVSHKTLTTVGRGMGAEMTMSKAAMGVLFDNLYTGGTYRNQFAMGMEKPLGTPQFEYMRKAYLISTIDRIIVNQRKIQMRHLGRLETPNSNSLGMSVRHMHYDDPTINTDTPQIRERQEASRALFKNFDSAVHHNFTQFLTAAVEDNLVYDRIAIVHEFDRKGRPTRYWCLDPTTIKPVLEVVLPLLRKQAKKRGIPLEAAYYGVLNSDKLRDDILTQMSEELRRTQGVDYDLTKAAYLQVINNTHITGAWGLDEITVFVSNPSNRINQWGYGISPFEMSLEIADLILAAWSYNKNLFNQEYPENLLVLGGGYDQQSLLAFKAHLKGAGMNQDKRLGVIASEDDQSTVNQVAAVVKLRESPRDMAFMEMLTLAINMKCAAYSMHPSTINIRETSGGGGVNFEQAGSVELKISTAQEQGFDSLVFMTCNTLTECLLGQYDDEMQLVPINLHEEDAKAKAALLQQDETATVNDKRRAMGRAEFPEDDPRGDKLASQVGIQIDAAQQQEEMMQQQQYMSLLQGDGAEAEEPQQLPNGEAAPNPKMTPVAASHGKGNIQKAVFEVEIYTDDD